MKLNLKNPIVFLDLETTGVDVANDRIIEISLVKVCPGSDTPEVKTRRIKPLDDRGEVMHIPEEATAVHGITDADVAGEPTFRQIAKSLAEYLKGCDLGGFNSNRFDIPMLAEEFLRAGVDIDLKRHKFVDVQTIFHKKEQRTLSAAYMFYCGKDLENAHAAEADTLATYEVLKGQLDKYEGDPRIENNVDKLAKMSTKQKTVDYAGRLILGDNDEPVISFGKHKGKTTREVYFSEPSYFAWIDNGDFTLDTKRQFARLKAQYEEEKKAAAPKRTTSVPRTKGYTPFEGLGGLFAQDND